MREEIVFQKWPKGRAVPLEILRLTCMDMGFATVGIVANLVCTVLSDGSLVDWRKL